ncbi:hypothetical protein [Flavobacterium sp. HBTb2-11-1]|uniref:hypothetical protein n=1 Tax=Flavobacterium sp. HBTb2-11-1 TaxID=2692212 RepID=UPI001371D0C3|nr:hypothetical protein [Flavobacterium sp. HBTb2-11-1]MXO06714.1 hypothetical protein [Flavobacterium sp. HBTb2-11-1]
MLILSFVGIILLVVMIFVFVQNAKDKKTHEEDLKRDLNNYDEESELHDVE